MRPDSVLLPQPTLDDFPEFVSIPLRVAQNARAWPDKRAVVCEDKTLIAAAQHHRQGHEARAARAPLGRPQRQDLV